MSTDQCDIYIDQIHVEINDIHIDIDGKNIDINGIDIDIKSTFQKGGRPLGWSTFKQSWVSKNNIAACIGAIRYYDRFGLDAEHAGDKAVWMITTVLMLPIMMSSPWL